VDVKAQFSRINAVIWSYFGRLTPTQFIVIGYLVLCVLSTLFLKLPMTHQEGVHITWMDAVFTATSAVSVTGLNTVNTALTFNETGKIALLVMFQVGGIGIMTLGAFLWLLFGRNISLSYRKLIMVDQNQHNLSGLVKLMKLVFYMAILIEAAGTLLLMVYFRLSGYYDDWLQAFVHGAFHSVSAFTNAGFDIYGDSLYGFKTDYYVQAVTMLLILFGAIGFPVLIEVREYFFGKHERFRFSLYTKMTALMFVFLITTGTLGIWFFEHNLYFDSLPWHEKFFHALFNSISTRSAGLATVDVNFFSVPTLVLMSALMFIGASPSSVGGGVRTTTFGVILLTLFSYALGRSEVRAFHRAIKQEDIIKSFVVFTAAAILVLSAIMLVGYTEDGRLSLLPIFFEVCSAFGTSGLSMGITPTLSDEGKWVLIVIMFIGRIGMLALLFMFRPKRAKQHFHYPKEDIIIG
jgi:potassium uptake TrkH family protein